LVCALIAQILTVAALGRAAYLGFYRRRNDAYEHLEPIRPGMKVSLILLSLGCIAFGALAGPFVTHVAGLAGAGLLDPAGYAAGALGSATSPPGAGAGFRYLDPNALALTAVELLLGLGLLVLALRTDWVSRLLSWPRRVHTGSVNDYVAFATVGMIVATGALLL
jgi:multicomponent Na+:H+ antiporter subunit D